MDSQSTVAAAPAAGAATPATTTSPTPSGVETHPSHQGSKPPKSQTKPETLLQAWPALLALCLTMLVEMVDNSVLNVALPTITRELGASATAMQWIVSAYSLTFGGLLMVGGTMGDMIGRKRTLSIGLALFGLAGLAVLFVTSPGQLIALRALSGAFAAMIAPLTMSLAFRLFDDAALRGRAIGVIVTVAMAGMAIGPVISGLAVEHFKWQYLLVANFPIALIALIGVRWGIAEDQPEDLRSGRLDITGAALSVGLLSSLLYALSLGPREGWLNPATLGFFALTIVLLAGFIYREHTAAEPMIDLAIFKTTTMRSAAALELATTMVMVGIIYISTQLFQFAWGYSPVKAGFASLPFVIGMLVLSPVIDAAIERLGRRTASALALIVMLVSLGFFAGSLGGNFWLAAAGMFLMAGGSRLIMTTAAVALIDSLPETQTSMGSALNDSMQEVGNALGVAVIGAVTVSVIGAQLPQGAWDQSTIAGFVHAQYIALGILATLTAVFGWLGWRVMASDAAAASTEGIAENPASPDPARVES